VDLQMKILAFLQVGVELEAACCTMYFKHHEESIGNTKSKVD